MSYYQNDCQNLPDHFCETCAAPELGKIGGVAFISNTFVFPGGDLSNHQSWLDGIASKDIIVIPATAAGELTMAEKTISGTGRQVSRLIGYEFTSTFNDPDYASNCAFWQQAKFATNYKYAYITQTKVHLTGVPVVIIPSNPVQNDINSAVEWVVKVMWQDSNFACPQNIPQGIFQCPPQS